MSPGELTASSFALYPAAGRALALRHLATLRSLPLVFLPFLLRELQEFDWRFPPEQEQVEGQLRFLGSVQAGERRERLRAFYEMQLPAALPAFDWVQHPAEFIERLSAHLWSSGQIDSFHRASEAYMNLFEAAAPHPLPSAPRLGMIVIGQGVSQSPYRLFRKLRRHGTYFDAVAPGGWASILSRVELRARSHPLPFAHWYVDGGSCAAVSTAITRVSYASLQGARERLGAIMRSAYEAPHFSAEAMRTMLGGLPPERLGLGSSGPEAIMSRFQVKLLTEGSGTQVFSTSFVQWAAHEAYRRAQPLTVVARFAPRVRSQEMNDLLAGGPAPAELDPEGSLIDADMAAWYTWIAQQRLPGADAAHFLVWYENHGQAVAVGPGFAKAAHDSRSTTLAALLAQTG